MFREANAAFPFQSSGTSLYVYRPVPSAATLRNTVFWDVTRCSVAGGTNVLEETAASMFRDAAGSSETLEAIYQVTRRHTSHNSNAYFRMHVRVCYRQTSGILHYPEFPPGSSLPYSHKSAIFSILSQINPVHTR